MAKTLYGTCPMEHWGELRSEQVPDLKTHTLWCVTCGQEMDPKLVHPVTQGWAENMKAEIRVTED
jgi:hypothetical protein